MTPQFASQISDTLLLNIIESYDVLTEKPCTANNCINAMCIQIFGFVEELYVENDPEFQWRDNFRYLNFLIRNNWLSECLCEQQANPNTSC
jgi:hypothetical protein